MLKLHSVTEKQTKKNFIQWEEVSPAFCLKTRVKADQERMIRGLLKDVLFCLDPIDVLEEKRTKTHPNIQSGIIPT